MFVCLIVCLFDGVYASFNNTSAISWRSALLVEETGFTDKLYHIMLYTSPWSRFELRTSVVIVICWQNRQMKNYGKSREHHNLKKIIVFQTNLFLQKKIVVGDLIGNPIIGSTPAHIYTCPKSWCGFPSVLYRGIFFNLRWDVGARLVDIGGVVDRQYKTFRENISFSAMCLLPTDPQSLLTTIFTWASDYIITRMCVHGPLFVTNQLVVFSWSTVFLLHWYWCPRSYRQQLQ